MKALRFALPLFLLSVAVFWHWLEFVFEHLLLIWDINHGMGSFW